MVSEICQNDKYVHDHKISNVRIKQVPVYLITSTSKYNIPFVYHYNTSSFGSQGYRVSGPFPYLIATRLL